MGVLHCDLKPDNILTERAAGDKFEIADLLNIERPFVLIDYGLSLKFIDEKGNHV